MHKPNEADPELLPEPANGELSSDELSSANEEDLCMDLEILQEELSDTSSDEDDAEFVQMFLSVDKLCITIKTKYLTSDATAAECLEELSEGLLKVGMEPDCVADWQALNELKEAEEVWSTFTSEQKNAAELLLLGGLRKLGATV